jgi:hypothetical protein
MTREPLTVPLGPWLVCADLKDGQTRLWTLEDDPPLSWLGALAALLRFDAMMTRERAARASHWNAWQPGTARLITLEDWRATR